MAAVPPEIRFWRFVSKGAPDECWLWAGGTNGRYGVFTAKTSRPMRKVYAHRFSYEMAVGPIPDGKVINHLCITPLCVNPAHLEVATYRENSRYGDGPAARRARQEVCIHGHPLDYVRSNGTRSCSTCLKARMKKRREAGASCVAEGCTKPGHTRGMCSTHYSRWLRTGGKGT